VSFFKVVPVGHTRVLVVSKRSLKKNRICIPPGSNQKGQILAVCNSSLFFFNLKKKKAPILRAEYLSELVCGNREFWPISTTGTWFVEH